MTEPNFWKIVLGLVFPMAPMPPPEPPVTITMTTPVTREESLEYVQSRITVLSAQSENPGNRAMLRHYRYRLKILSNPDDPDEAGIQHNRFVP